MYDILLLGSHTSSGPSSPVRVNPPFPFGPIRPRFAPFAAEPKRFCPKNAEAKFLPLAALAPPILRFAAFRCKEAIHDPILEKTEPVLSSAVIFTTGFCLFRLSALDLTVCILLDAWSLLFNIVFVLSGILENSLLTFFVTPEALSFALITVVLVSVFDLPLLNLLEDLLELDPLKSFLIVSKKDLDDSLSCLFSFVPPYVLLFL